MKHTICTDMVRGGMPECKRKQIGWPTRHCREPTLPAGVLGWKALKHCGFSSSCFLLIFSYKPLTTHNWAILFWAYRPHAERRRRETCRWSSVKNIYIDRKQNCHVYRELIAFSEELRNFQESITFAMSGLWWNIQHVLFHVGNQYLLP